jgi:hypothetical protein
VDDGDAKGTILRERLGNHRKGKLDDARPVRLALRRCALDAWRAARSRATGVPPLPV